MLRILAVLISTLVATSAHAQDASKPKAQEEPTSAAPPVVVAPRGPPAETEPPLSPPSAPAAKPGEEPTDCGMEQSFFDEADVPFATRTYEAAPSTVDRHQQKGWKSRPAVTTAGRCLQRYTIQVKSKSEKPWPVKEATLVGSDGKVLKVIRIRPRKAPGNISLNIITAMMTEGVARANYMLSTVVLIGEDGQAVVLHDVKLP